MFRLVLLGFCWCLLVLSGANVLGGTYTLTDGQIIPGDPISYSESGLVLRSPAEGILPRISWGRFSQESLKELKTQARNPRDAAFVEPFIAELIEEKVKRKKVVLKPVPRVELPAGRGGMFAAFSSPLGLTIFGALFFANLYAAYEIARYRRQPPILVVVLSAFFPVAVPIIFLALPTRTEAEIEAELSTAAEAAATLAAAPAVHAESAAPAHEGAPARGGLKVAGSGRVAEAPEPVIFQKGVFTFNRRFFETRLPGFFRVVPSDAEKDMVLFIKAIRGEYAGRRISRISPNDLDLQTFKGEATADVTIPFTEIQEVQIRHKDMVRS